MYLVNNAINLKLCRFLLLAPFAKDNQTTDEWQQHRIIKSKSNAQLNYAINCLLNNETIISASLRAKYWSRPRQTHKDGLESFLSIWIPILIEGDENQFISKPKQLHVYKLFLNRVNIRVWDRFSKIRCITEIVYESCSCELCHFLTCFN